MVTWITIFSYYLQGIHKALEYTLYSHVHVYTSTLNPETVCDLERLIYTLYLL